MPASLTVTGLALAAMLGAAPSGADNGSTNDNSSNGGGPIHDAVEEFGQSLCPKLVKPGSDLAAAVSEMKGNSGLTPTLTGMIAGLAIQLECPAFMSSVANGQLPDALNKVGDSPISPLLQMQGLGTPPGMSNAPSNPKNPARQ